jgi:glycosyltransferase involved in cell wall biosynthesis
MNKSLEVLYLCDFDLRKGRGKDRATYQKLQALKGKVSRLRVVNSDSSNLVMRLISVILLDFKASFWIIFDRPDYLISRGNSGLLSQIMCKIFRVRTVREVHANALDELELLPYQGVKRYAIEALAHIAHRIDLAADVRVFNHPDLLRWYQDKAMSSNKDFFVYNGFDENAKSNLSKDQAREKFGFKGSDRLIVFVGSVSKWHGIEYLVDLQREFDLFRDDIKIVVGGGDLAEFDASQLCINISPLSDKACADLICASDFCALPVKNNRVSPGSPLKLYDYIVNERYVFAQSSTNGYSDEVLHYGVGCPVDFTSPSTARIEILRAFDSQWSQKYPKCSASWSDRMDSWLDGIQQ